MEELSASNQRLAANVFETMNQGVMVTDHNNHIEFINQATTDMTGYTLEEVKGESPKIFASGRNDQTFYQHMWGAINDKGYWEGEMWNRKKDGTPFLQWMTVNVIRNPQGKVSQHVAIFSDITERKKTEELIWRQANFDALTGLPNRAMLHSRLDEELAMCSRRGYGLAVVYLDIDGFKDVNDSLGHDAGDKLLVCIAQRLKGQLRNTDTIARWGGDEFTIVLNNLEHPEWAGAMAQKFIALINEPIDLHGREIQVGGSAGIAIYPEDGETQEALTTHADIAMYQAKHNGKNQFQFFHAEMKQNTMKRLATIDSIKSALEGQDFELYYQPQIRLRDKKIVGMEALVRMDGGDKGIASPSQFIPCAEETGLIIPLGEWVLSEACRQVSEWNEKFGIELCVAVNLSAKQFRAAELTEIVLQNINQYSLAAHQIELEITESVLMDDVEQAIKVMSVLDSLGISIAIDDFGTGYSSLSYLKRFPISTLKIDQSFISDLKFESDDAAIVRSVIALAESLQLNVVAEGVEEREQMQMLQQLDCQLAQGYYFAEPMDAVAFERFLQTLERREWRLA